LKKKIKDLLVVVFFDILPGQARTIPEK